jgi:hypothetical protein
MFLSCKVMIAAENTAIPSFLRTIEDRRYEVAPCRRPLHSAWVEYLSFSLVVW